MIDFNVSWLFRHHVDRMRNQLRGMRGSLQCRYRVIAYRIGWLCRYSIQILRVLVHKVQLGYWHVRDGLSVRVAAFRRRLASR